MKRKRMIFSIFAMIFVFTVCLSSMTVFAQSNYVNSFKDKIDITDTKDVNDSINKIFKDNVAPLLIAHRQDLIYSDISDQAITNAILSAPMPVFSSNSKYKKGEDFKNKLTHSGWQIIVYTDDKQPIAVFSVDKQNNGYVVTNIFNENFAKSCSDAITQLNSDTPIVLPLGGYFFMADTSDNVALAKPQNNTDVKYSVKTFDELNNAANKSIDYYSSQTEPADGGSVVIDYLYGSNTINSSTSSIYIIVLIMCAACLVSAVILFRKSKLKLKIN